MLTQSLAACSRTPPVVLDALVAHARTTGLRHLAPRLVTNPAVPVEQAATISPLEPFLHLELLSRRRDLTPTAVHALLTTNPPKRITPTTLTHLLTPTITSTPPPALDTMLSVLPPQTLALLLRLGPGHSPAHVRRSAATHLAKHHGSSSLDHLRIHAAKTLAQATTPDAYTDALAHLDTLASTNPALATTLAPIRATHAGPAAVTPGTAEWLASPQTTPTQITSWLQQHDHPDHWQRALLTCYDPDDTIASAALGSGTTNTKVLNLVAEHAHGLPVRQRAVLRLCDLGHTPGTVDTALLTGGDPDLAVQLLGRMSPARTQVAEAVCRHDLTTDHLDQLLTMIHAGDVPRTVGMAALTGVAVHPAAGQTQRLSARGVVAALRPSPTVRKLLRSVADDPTAAATTTPLPHLLSYFPDHQPLGHLVVHTLADLAPDLTRDAATVLVVLADTFTGTLSQLITTATTVTT